MRTGRDIQAIAKELQTIKDKSRDFVVPTSELSVNPTGGLTFTNGETHTFGLNGHAHGQLATYSGVPRLYYDKIKEENPDLLSQCINHGLHTADAKERFDGNPNTRMIRTIDGTARAVLSANYKRLDCFDMVNTVLPLMEAADMKIVSCELTERRLYIKALSPKITSEISKGDPVQYGLVISNSDVGSGSVRIEPLIYRLVCLNGMISPTAMKRLHIGGNQYSQDVYELLSDNTRKLTDEAFWAQVKDVTESTMRKEIFEAEVDRIRQANNDKIENFDIPRVIELTSKALSITGEETKNSMVAYLANGADGAGLTRWGLVNAVTKAAQGEHLSYDQATDLERKGSDILDLSSKDWNKIAAKPA